MIAPFAPMQFCKLTNVHILSLEGRISRSCCCSPSEAGLLPPPAPGPESLSVGDTARSQSSCARPPAGTFPAPGPVPAPSALGSEGSEALPLGQPLGRPTRTLLLLRLLSGSPSPGLCRPPGGDELLSPPALRPYLCGHVLALGGCEFKPRKARTHPILTVLSRAAGSCGFALLRDSYTHQPDLCPQTPHPAWHGLVGLIPKRAFLEEPSCEQTRVVICGYPVRRQEGPGPRRPSRRRLQGSLPFPPL